MSFFVGYKGQEPWPTCARCKCLRRPGEVQDIGTSKQPFYICSDSAVCARLSAESRRSSR